MVITEIAAKAFQELMVGLGAPLNAAQSNCACDNTPELCFGNALRHKIALHPSASNSVQSNRCAETGFGIGHDMDSQGPKSAF